MNKRYFSHALLLLWFLKSVLFSVAVVDCIALPCLVFLHLVAEHSLFKIDNSATERLEARLTHMNNNLESMKDSVSKVSMAVTQVRRGQ
jgi:hypothetical protein